MTTTPSTQTSTQARREVVLVANFRAGRGAGARAAEAARVALAAEGVAVRLRATAGPGDAVEIARSEAVAGAQDLVAVGGDGTVHEVANGILAARAPARLGLVPVGTGNDYARMLGVPRDDAAAAARAFLAGEARPVDVGRLEGADRGPEFFVNNVGAALLGVANAARFELPLLPGPVAYRLGGYVSFLRFKAERLTVVLDGVSIEGRFLAVHFGPGSFCGSGIRLTPGAVLDDGLFDVCLVVDMPKLRALADWPRIARGEDQDDVARCRARQVRLVGPRGSVVHADGEVRRVPTGVLEAVCLPRALNVVFAPVAPGAPAAPPAGARPAPAQPAPARAQGGSS